MDPDTIWQALYGQESNYGTNNATSVAGARGPGQILPQTFNQYALPGENINNEKDNVNVSKRIVYDAYNKYGADPGRIATTYFSGPGNVAPPGSQTPFKQNRADATGKTTASYVLDISKRVASMANQNSDLDATFSQWEKSAPNAAASTKFDPATAFGQWEKPSAVQVAPSSIQAGSHIPVPTEAMTPQQQADQAERIRQGTSQNSGWWEQNYHPLSAIPQTFQAGREQVEQGLQDITSGNVATGTGNVFMGGLNTALAPILGPYNETTRAAGVAIGNPQAANVSSLVASPRGRGG